VLNIWAKLGVGLTARIKKTSGSIAALGRAKNQRFLKDITLNVELLVKNSSL
jgi:hypothetical protein